MTIWTVHLQSTVRSLSKSVDLSLEKSESKPWIVDWLKWEIPGRWPVQQVWRNDWFRDAPFWFPEELRKNGLDDVGIQSVNARGEKEAPLIVFITSDWPFQNHIFGKSYLKEFVQAGTMTALITSYF
ncbi:uncharacterized protein BJ212DRAFT_1297305 [Suillus subaureus]|uniref:Uncharacterized protein n=1 Tax=Suillus subaureus TaxID=48587 RepID=A0A9P7EHN1_9AGAM|nr:uncharacterized protein BJ212DRAFT_1297305 [Suillus subaureus]KAG1822064.1 hypothetical protein BJ212DRAFT_1297305 [Suillus subaureus]